MGKKDIFRTAVLGGYQKEDVMDYIRSLENEKETIRVLTKKESSGIKAQLEKEKAAGEELREALALLKEENRRLKEKARFLGTEPEERNGQNQTDLEAKLRESREEITVDSGEGRGILEELRIRVNEDREWKKEILNRDTVFQELLMELKRSNEDLEERCRQMEECLASFPENPLERQIPEEELPGASKVLNFSVQEKETALIKEKLPDARAEIHSEPIPKQEEALSEQGEVLPEQVKTLPEQEEALSEQEESAGARKILEETAREKEEEGGSIVQKAEPASKYKEKAYESLIDTKKKAENLLAALEMDTSFAL